MIAMSLSMLEVKPLDDQTNLDDLENHRDEVLKKPRRQWRLGRVSS